MNSAPRPSRLAAAATLLGLCLTCACSRKGPPAFDPGVIATVNGTQITIAAFERELARELKGTEPSAVQTPAQLEPFKKSVLDTMVERALLLQAAKATNIQISPADVDRRILRLRADYPAEGFEAMLAEGQVSMAELKEKTEALMTIEKLYEEYVYPRVAVTEEEMQSYFDQNADLAKEPEQVRAAQIVVRDIDEARRIQSQLRSGKRFADLARRYSLSADAKVGGDLGYFARGVMPTEFDRTVFSLSVGQVSDVVTSEYGYHLFKLLEVKPARRKSLTEMRPQIEAALLKEKRQKAEIAYLDGLKAKADIRVNNEALAAVRGSQPQAKAK
jgi:peptidyl-prolyl cis-trans isomerase C